MSLERIWGSAWTTCPASSTSRSGILTHCCQSNIRRDLCWRPQWPSKVVLFRSFVFRPEYQRMASLVLSRAKEFFAEKEQKMRKNKETKMRKKERQRKSQTTFVGIHNRRGDHIQYQKEVKYQILYAITLLDWYSFSYVHCKSFFSHERPYVNIYPN